ncbi:MAG TPA: hypothetical protein VJO53_11940 [Candidatus Acidoferrales bacterium]|nr:hypothetical protein [Candidatus Acidoferrales bacterium]
MARSDRSAGDTEVQSTVHSSKLLKPTSRLLLIRYVDGEFAKAVQSLPGGRKGLKVSVGKPMDMQGLSDSLRLYGIAATQGDTVQITGMEIRSQQIVLQINGGGKKHFHLRQHIQIGIGNMSTPPPPVSGPPEISGATIVLDYGHPVPDMSPDDLKRDLSVLLDFSKQHSATINWVESLPPQFQQAIRDRHAIVGMNQDMVIAAMGRPDHKVRERDAEGNETEDWIYGTPPARTTFVTFSGDSVIRVKDFE